MANANPMLGEADLGERTIRVNFNTWCIAEGALGLKVPDILALIQSEGLGFDDLRRLVRSFLVGGAKMTLEEVGDFIGEVGLDATGEAVKVALERFFPAPQADNEESADRPPKAA